MNAPTDREAALLDIISGLCAHVANALQHGGYDKLQAAPDARKWLAAGEQAQDEAYAHSCSEDGLSVDEFCPDCADYHVSGLVDSAEDR